MYLWEVPQQSKNLLPSWARNYPPSPTRSYRIIGKYFGDSMSQRKSSKPITEAEAARLNAGFTLERAAKKARVVPAYLRRIELHGRAPYVLAARLASLYQCPITVFLYAKPLEHAGAVGVSSEPGQSQQAATTANLPRPSNRYRRPATPILTVIEGDRK